MQKKKRNVLIQKLQPVLRFKVGIFFSTAIITQLESEAIYDKHSPLTASVCNIESEISCESYRCTSTVKKHYYKLLQVILLPAIG